MQSTQYSRTSISAKVIADSVYDQSRLTTFEVTFPRFILAEFNTHRVLSRNSASSRAIPVWKRLWEVINHPFIPLQFGRNKAGMQAAEGISGQDAELAMRNWLVGRDVAVIQAYMLAGGERQIMIDAKNDPRAEEVCTYIKSLAALTYQDVHVRVRQLSAGVHKQHANRVLEPYAWHTVIVTGTDWRNFYALRASKLAQPEIKDLALAMARAHLTSTPQELQEGEWHLPFIFDEDRRETKDTRGLARISSARCARVSYLTHDGKRSLDKDLAMATDLQVNGHMSPFEHPAKAGAEFFDCRGNFSGDWIQLRKLLENEDDFSFLIRPEDFLEGFDGDQALVDFVLSLFA